jgi:hypothetical protein
LAAAIIFRPDLCTWSSGKVHVDPEGRTTFTQGEGTDRVAIDVNVEAFFEDFFSVTSSH